MNPHRPLLGPLQAAALAAALLAPALASAGRPAKREAHPKWPTEKRCAALLDQLTADTRAGAEKLGVKDATAAAERFRKGVQRWDEVCKALPEPALACLEAADDTVLAMGRCGVHEGRKSFKERVFLPMVASEFVDWHTHARQAPKADAATTAKVLAAVAWRWSQKDSWAEKTLTIAPDGTVTYREVRTPKGKRPGELKEQTGTLEVQGAYRVDVVMRNGTRFNWSMLRDGERLLTSNQTGTGAYAVTPGGGETRFAVNGQYVLGKGLLTEVPRCFLYGPRFEALPAHCEWQGRGDAKRLVLTRDGYVSPESGTKMPAYPMRFGLLQGALVPDSWLSPKASDAWTRVP